MGKTDKLEIAWEQSVQQGRQWAEENVVLKPLGIGGRMGWKTHGK
jgi:hypothetical protein